MLEQSIELEELTNKELLQSKIITIEDLFKQNNKIKLQEKELQYFLNGVKISRKESDGLYRIYDQYDKFIGLGQIEQSKLKRDIVNDVEFEN